MTSTEYSKGYMAGLADAQKQAVSSLTGNPMAKKVWIACPACGKQSPVADPDARLLEPLITARNRIQDMLMGDDGQAWDEARKALPGIEAAIAKAQGVAL
jgi:hypothetical protein